MKPAWQVVPMSGALAGALIAVSNVAVYPWTSAALCLAFAMWVLEPTDE